jgi:hypothetical protein
LLFEGGPADDGYVSYLSGAIAPGGNEEADGIEIILQ